MGQEAQPDTPAAPEAAGDDGFEAAFSARSRGDEAPQPAGDEPAKPEEPAPAGSEDDAPAPAAAKEAAPAPQAPDFFDGLSPEQKAYFERLRDSERSQRGRVAALTRKLNTSSQPAPTPAPAQGSEQQPSEGDQDKAPKADDLEARLERVAEEYGDVNGPLVEALKAVRREIAEMKPKVDQVDLDKDQAAITTALTELEGKHPDYATIAADPAFVAWGNSQPPRVQELLNSYDPDEVSLGLTLYKAERGLTQAPAGQGQEGNNGRTATGDRRARQLEGSRELPSRGAPAAAGVPDDFEAAFKARSKQNATT